MRRDLSKDSMTQEAVIRALAEEMAVHGSESAISDAALLAQIGIDVGDLLLQPKESRQQKTRLDESLSQGPYTCLNCWMPVSPNSRACSHCDRPLDLDLARLLRTVSFDAAYFGWLYRKQFEKDLSESTSQEIHKHYILSPPSEWLVWIASVIATGILGNFSYDVVKKVVQSKLKGRKSLGKQGAVPRDFPVDDFIEYVGDYLKSLLDSGSPLFKAFFFYAAILACLDDAVEQGQKPQIPESPEQVIRAIENLSPFGRDQLSQGLERVRRVHVVREHLTREHRAKKRKKRTSA